MNNLRSAVSDAWSDLQKTFCGTENASGSRMKSAEEKSEALACDPKILLAASTKEWRWFLDGCELPSAGAPVYTPGAWTL